jgi:putative acetyltransferase
LPEETTVSPQPLSPREFFLHDGRPAVVRLLRLDDAAGMFDVERALHEDGRGMVLSPEQAPPDVDAELARIAPWVAVNEADTGSVALVAEVRAPSPRIIGSATIDRLRPAYCRHVGVLALGVEPAHQALGAGRALMEALIEHARASGLLRVELYVRADNDRARALYESLGFVLEGVRRRFVRLPDGTFVDDHVMGALV